MMFPRFTTFFLTMGVINVVTILACPFLRSQKEPGAVEQGSSMTPDEAMLASLLAGPTHLRESHRNLLASSPPPPPPPPPPGPHPQGNGPSPSPSQSWSSTSPHPVPSQPPRSPTSGPTPSPSLRRVTSSPSPSPTNTNSKTPSASPTVMPTIGGYTAPFCLKTNGGTVVPSKPNTCSAWKQLNVSWPGIVHSLPNPLDLAHLYGAGLRLAFHDAGEVNVTVRSDFNGPDGCLSSDQNNAGLVEPTSPVSTIIEPMWQQVCDRISRADFWAMFGKKVVEYTDPTQTISIPFQYGRKDRTACETGRGRLPNAQNGLKAFHTLFQVQMGLTVNDGVTLLGGHTLGHVHPSVSGYGLNIANPNLNDNAWDLTPSKFDNGYYVSMLGPPWTNTIDVVANVPSKSIFTTRGNQIMLGTDMVLGFPADTATVANGFQVGEIGQICASNLPPPNKAYGCTSAGGLAPVTTTQPSTFAMANTFAKSNAAFLVAFAVSYSKMVSVGYGPSGKLGTLTSIDFSTCT